jgi:F-type H+-transporting ATPase subunit epsilon
MAKTLKLRIVTQERELLETEAISVTAMTEAGEVTILPGHIPLFSTLATGELHYVLPDKKEMEFVAVSGGFLDVSPEGGVTIWAAHALRAGDIDVAAAEAAKLRAEEIMRDKADQRSSQDFRIAEMELLRSINELNIARRRKGGR